MAATEYYYGTAAAQQMGNGSMERRHGSGSNLAQMGRPYGSGSNLMQMGGHASSSNVLPQNASSSSLSQMGNPYPLNPNLMQPQPQHPQPQQLVHQYNSTTPPMYVPYQAPTYAPMTQTQPQSPRPYAQPGGYQQQPGTYPPQPKPYPSSGSTSYPAQSQWRQTYQPQHGDLQTRPARSRSQPPRVRFANHDSDSPSQSDSPDSGSRSQRHRRRKHRHSYSDNHHHGRSGSSDFADRDHDRDYDSDHTRSHHHHHRHRDPATHKKEHKNRDTLIGASAGGLIGDAIFPGLGTVGGLLLGGYGGRKHAKKRRSESGGSISREEEWAKDGHWQRPRSSRDSGWDEESATFKMGSSVR